MSALALASAASVLAGTAPADAYCFLTPTPGAFNVDLQSCTTDPHRGMTWQFSCASLSINPNGVPPDISADGLRYAVDSAAGAWNAVRCPGGGAPSFSFVPYPDVDGSFGFFPAGQNSNLVSFRDPWPSTPFHVPGEPAAALLTFNPQAAHIIDFDVDLNPRSILQFTTMGAPGAIDLQTFMTQQLGFMMGIGYSADPDAVMSRDFTFRTPRRVLGQDDIMAMCTLYPPGGGTTCDPEPYNGFEGGKGCGCAVPGTGRRPDGVAGLLAAALAALVARAARRRRR